MLKMTDLLALNHLILHQARLVECEFASKMVYDGFYPMADSCQISGLSKIYEQIFGKTNEGLFVEVGAHDGHDYSNTAGLADLGWKGLYVEPLLESAFNCASRHKDNNCIVINKAVGSEAGSLKLVFGLDGALTTSNPELIEKFSDYMGMEYEAEMVTLDTILRHTGIEPNFELLVVDTEGYEENLFKAFNIDYYLPKMMIVELSDIHYDFVGTEIAKSHARVRDYIKAKGYSMIYGDIVNSVFVLDSILADD